MEQDRMVPDAARVVAQEWAKAREEKAGWADLVWEPAEDVHVRAAGKRALTSAACPVRRPNAQTAAL